MLVERIILKCNRDDFRRIGILDDFKDLTIVTECISCSGIRVKCPKCGYLLKGKKILIDDQYKVD